MHRLDVLLALSTSNADPAHSRVQWEAVSAALWEAEPSSPLALPSLIPAIMQRRLTLTGSTLRARSVGFKSLVADEIMRSVWPFVTEGKLRPAMDQTFPLKDAAKAHARMDAGEHFGKIVLVV